MCFSAREVSHQEGKRLLMSKYAALLSLSTGVFFKVVLQKCLYAVIKANGSIDESVITSAGGFSLE